MFLIENDFFGFAVKLFRKTLIIGAPGNQGSIYIYTLDNNSWNFDKKLTVSNNISFGKSIDIYNNYAVIGAPDIQTIYILKYIDNRWEIDEKITNTRALKRHENFGYSVAINNKFIVVGSPGKFSGSVYIYNFLMHIYIIPILW